MNANVKKKAKGGYKMSGGLKGSKSTKYVGVLKKGSKKKGY